MTTARDSHIIKEDSRQNGFEKYINCRRSRLQITRYETCPECNRRIRATNYVQTDPFRKNGQFESGGEIMCRMVISLMIVGLCVHTAAALDGSGTQEDPWRIQSLADFDEFAADPNYWAGFTRLETDVILAGRTYTRAVIAPDVDNSNGYFDGTAFTGVFDGNDHKITGLTIDGGANGYLGLFGCIHDGEIRDLGLEDGSVSGSDYVGGLVGANGDWFHKEGVIANCYSTSDVSGNIEIGCLVGENWGNTSNCYSTGDVRGIGSIGGLVGSNVFGSVSNCYFIGSVSGDDQVGGLVGGNHYDYVFGLRGSISNCYSTGNVNGTAYSVGGLVGVNDGGVSNCYSMCNVNGDSNDCGGLVGANAGIVSNCYSTGNVNGAYDVGGLVGHSLGIVSNCFWDLESSIHYSDGGTGKTTAEMKTRSTFTDAGWNFFEIWLINEGATYPVLRQEIRSDLNGDAGVDLKDLALFADHWLEGKDN